MFRTEIIGKKIAELRKEKNMTQMELANVMGVSYQAVSNWERGTSLPDISKLPELSEIFGCSIDCILGKGREVGLVEHVIKEDAGNYIREQEITKEEVLAVAPLLKPSQTEDVLKVVLHSEKNREVKSENNKMTDQIKPEQTRPDQAQEETNTFQNSTTSQCQDVFQVFQDPQWADSLQVFQNNFNSQWMDTFQVFQNNSNSQWTEGSAQGEETNQKNLIYQQQNSELLNSMKYPIARTEAILEENKVSEQTRNELQIQEQNETQQEMMSMEELGQIAPFVSQGFLEEILRKELMKCPDLNFSPLTPFLSGSFLHEIVRTKLTQGSCDKLGQYAPFLERETFLLLVKTFVENENYDQIAPFIPFLDNDILEQLVNSLIEQGHYGNITQYAPFLRSYALEQIADQLYQLGGLGQIQSLAPFLPEAKLLQIIAQEMKKGNFASIKPFYPFLSEKALESILRQIL